MVQTCGPRVCTIANSQPLASRMRKQRRANSTFLRIGEYAGRIGRCLTHKICMRSAGCTVGDKSYALNEIWHDYSLWKYKNCMQDSGCQCGNTVCKITDDCHPDNNECIVNNAVK